MLRIEGLRKCYDRFALDCTMEVIPGHITALIGQNGAGKSTTFKAALGLISIDGGTIKLFGRDISDIDANDRKKLGVVLSDSGFSGYLTINDVISILSNMYDGFDMQKFVSMTERFKLPRRKKLKEFSTGMKAKLKVIAAISHESRLLILDEPTAGLDVIARDEVLELLRDYMQEDDERAILISSHISSDLETICDDVYMIHEGRIIMHEDTDVILGEYALMKMSAQQFADIDKRYILKSRQESYGFSCLTNQRQYYCDNYPQLSIENGTIDKTITMMVRGNEI